LLGFLNYKGIGGSFIALADTSRLASNLSVRKYYQIEDVLFIPLSTHDRSDDRLLRKLDNFQKLMVNFGYYSVGGNTTSQLIGKSKE
jgi:hypothetical protein